MKEKFIVLVMNEMHFDQTKYDQSPILGETKISWHEFPSRNQKYTFEVQPFELTREDNLIMSIPKVTKHTDSFFTIEKVETETRTSARSTRLQMSFTMSRNLIQIERTVYNVFLLLSDVGGLIGLLFSLSAGLLKLLNFESMENGLVGELYVNDSSGSVLDPSE